MPLGRWRDCVAWGSAAALMAGCNLAWGINDLLFDGTAGAGGSGGTAQEHCPDGAECVPDPAAGDFVREAAGGVACPADWLWTTSLYDGLDPGCMACACSIAAGGECRLLVHRYPNAQCAAPDTSATDGDGTCANTTMSTLGYGVESPTATQGSCTPSGGGSTPLEPRTVCRLAEPSGVACGAGKVCVPKAEGSLGAACVLLAGHGAPCPQGYGPEGDFYEQAVDGRQCTCSCSDASAASCVGTAKLSLYDADGCGGGLVRDIAVPDGCASVNVQAESYRVEAGEWTGGSCVSTASTGEVSFSVPVTLCCPP